MLLPQNEHSSYDEGNQHHKANGTTDHIISYFWLIPQTVPVLQMTQRKRQAIGADSHLQKRPASNIISEKNILVSYYLTKALLASNNTQYIESTHLTVTRGIP